MKENSKLISMFDSSLVLALAALLLLVVPGASAKHRPTETSEQPASVIAHIALPGAPANQILLQERDDKQYLYLVRNSRKGFTVVDATKPSQPNLLKRVAWPDGASAGKLQLVNGRLGFAEGSNVHFPSASAESSPETVELLDLSDPANPRTVETLSDVTSVFIDEGGGLIYITNPEGLSIVRTRPEQHILPSCTSADAIASMPECE